jgi:hypothetical protein
MDALAKDHRARVQAILTDEQRFNYRRTRRLVKPGERNSARKRQDKLKKGVEPTDEQSAKMAENGKASAEK